MRWTCEKCGKKLDISEEQLSETQGVIVCPQCLATDTIPGYKRAKKKADPKPRPQTNSPQKQAQPQPQKTATTPKETKREKPSPPPYKKKTTLVERPATTPRQAQPVSQLVRKPKTPGNKKKKSNKKGTPTSGWECLWKSIVFTIVLLAVYLLIGFLIQGV